MLESETLFHYCHSCCVVGPLVSLLFLNRIAVKKKLFLISESILLTLLPHDFHINGSFQWYRQIESWSPAHGCSRIHPSLDENRQIIISTTWNRCHVYFKLHLFLSIMKFNYSFLKRSKDT